MIYEKRKTCRACHHQTLESIIALGNIPLADALLSQKELEEEELKVPLTLVLCPNCSLVQVKEDVHPEILFCRNYPYYSSVSKSLSRHFQQSAIDILDKYALNQKSLVLEAASNDGYLLQHFKQKNIPILGIEPASGQAAVAQKKGIPTINTFLTKTLATQLVIEKEVQADIFLANNVLAHVPDPNDFIAGVQLLLKKEGTAIFEVPYLLDLVEKCEFDTIFHQHFSYFSLHALKYLFERNGLYLNDVERIPVHGGSIRFFVSFKKGHSPQLKTLLATEATSNINHLNYYLEFIAEVKNLKHNLTQLLQKLKSKNHTIAAYGAAGKTNTLLNYMGIGKNYLEYIADLSPHKQGRYFTGNHLPIVAPDFILKTMPDYVLITAWNLAEEIIHQLQPYHQKGGNFIVPLPKLKIL